MQQLKQFHIHDLNPESLDAMAEHYQRDGFCVLTGIDDEVTDLFERTVARIIGANDGTIGRWLKEDDSSPVFSPEIRKQLARVESSDELKHAMLAKFRLILMKLLGPLVHVSSTFHSQFKNLSAKSVDHGGYTSEMQYMEVHGPYLLHQDFAGASFPTTPSMLIVWIPLNSSPDWNLRLYRGSHRLGLLCNTWLDLNHDSLSEIGEAVDIQARKGSAVIFNAMTLHGTSNAGPQRRVSCDIRFFPLCGFLPSEVHFLDSQPLQQIEKTLKGEPREVLRAPLLEDLIYLSAGVTEQAVPLFPVKGHSVLNWVNYLSLKTRGRFDEASESLCKFVNMEKGIDQPAVYLEKFHPHPFCWATVHAVSDRIEANSKEWAQELSNLVNAIHRPTKLV
jgi:hypothetical protein